jgi:hypothetical protein
MDNYFIFKIENKVVFAYFTSGFSINLLKKYDKPKIKINGINIIKTLIES